MWFLDVNILLNAFFEESPHHQQCRSWLDTSLQENRSIALCHIVELGFLRIATLSVGKKVGAPLSLASDFLSALYQSPITIRLETGPAHWTIFKTLSERYAIVGSDLTDAWLAALAIENDACIVSADRDFLRFKELNCFNPIV